MIKPVSPVECKEILISYGYSKSAAEALSLYLFLEEEEAGENYCLGASIVSEWEEFPSFQAAQKAVGGAYIPNGMNIDGGGFLMRKNHQPIVSQPIVSNY